MEIKCTKNERSYVRTLGILKNVQKQLPTSSEFQKFEALGRGALAERPRALHFLREMKAKRSLVCLRLG